MKKYNLLPLMEMAYKKMLKPVLFQFGPDEVHKVFVKAGQEITRQKSLLKILNTLYGNPLDYPATEVDGVRYYGKVLLSAGFDYNGHLPHCLWHMGFSGEEVGSVTAKPTKGNPPPNLTRLVRNQSIQVYKGLRNDGVDSIIHRLKKNPSPEGFVLGISIAKTNDSSTCTVEGGIEDMLYSLKRLQAEYLGHFYTINISCPNAFGGEDFTVSDNLERLLIGMQKLALKVPVYFKMPINQSYEKLKVLCQLIEHYHYQGLVIGNLNKNYQDLTDPTELRDQKFRGGLSGKPCQKLSNELIQKVRSEFKHLTIMGCGGVLTPEDCTEKIASGAQLVQLISGMIFNGPHLIHQCQTAMAAKT